MSTMPGNSASKGIDWGAGIGAVGDLVSGIGSFLGSQANAAALGQKSAGLRAEGQSYFKAAELEGFNEQYAKASGDIQIAQQLRKNYQTESGTKADIAGAGFAEGGSGGDILRSNAQQGALTAQLLGVQSEIQQNTYEIQKNAYSAEGDAAFSAAAAADAEASSAGAGGILGTIGTVLGVAAKAAPFIMSL